MENKVQIEYDKPKDHKWSHIRRFDAGHLALAIVA